MTKPTSFVTESLHVGLMLSVVGIVINGVQCQLSSPVLVRESETASFRWQIPAVPGRFTVLYVISPSGAAVLLANTVNNHQVTGNYTTRVTYTGNLTADPKVMAFDLHSVVRSDAGNYTCGVTGLTDIIPQCGQKLVVLGQPTKPTVIGPSSPVFGRQVILTCSSTSTTVPNDHGLTLTYTWQRDNTDISVTSPGSPYAFTVSSRGSHSYRCRGSESQGLESEWSQMYNMEPQCGFLCLFPECHAEDGPYAVTLQPSTLSYTISEGQESVPPILCSSTCKPVCTYKWFKDGISHNDGASLTLPVADRSQTGSYKCQASNTYGVDDSSGVSVDVTYHASISMLTANSVSGSVTVNESDSVTFRCELDNVGNPKSVIILLNGTEELTMADNSTTASYRMESADCKQRGNYSCIASNNVGEPVTKRVELLVKCSPRLDDSLSKQLRISAGVGSDVTLSVPILAYPLPTFTWSRTNSTSQNLNGSSSPVSDISVTVRLHLTNLQQQDFGDYNLTVDNGIGGSVIYTVSIEPAGPPQTPTQFRDLDNATTSSVWLSWLPGFNGGRTQTFIIEYRQFATRTWTVHKSYADSGKMMVVELTGLMSGEIYIFRLQAENDYGDSNRYVFVEATTTGDPPAQPKPDAACTYTEVVAGATVGTFLLTLLVGGTVLMVLYRKGYRIGNNSKGARKSSSHPEPVEMDEKAYSSLDQVNVQAQYSHLDEESEKQQYTQLKMYENTKDAAADTSSHDGVAETPSEHHLTYESIRTSPYQNTGSHSQGPDHGDS